MPRLGTFARLLYPNAATEHGMLQCVKSSVGAAEMVGRTCCQWVAGSSRRGRQLVYSCTSIAQRVTVALERDLLWSGRLRDTVSCMLLVLGWFASPVTGPSTLNRLPTNACPTGTHADPPLQTGLYVSMAQCHLGEQALVYSSEGSSLSSSPENTRTLVHPAGVPAGQKPTATMTLSK